jgi:hypothetical protein
MSRRIAVAAFTVAALLVAFALWDYVAARRLSVTVEKIRAAGEPVLNDTDRLRPQTDEQKDASRYYAAAGMLVRDGWGRRYAKIDGELAALLASRPASAPPSLVDELSAVVGQHRPFYEILDRAASIDARGLAYGDEPRFSIADRSYSTVNGLRVALLSLTRHPAEAVSALRSTLAVPRVSSHLWRVGLDTTRDLELLLTYAPPSAAELQQLQNAYATMEIEDDVPEGVMRERARFITMVWPAAASPPTVLPRVRAGMNRSPLIGWFQRPLNTMRARAALQLFEEAIVPASQPWPSKFEAVDAFVRNHPVAQFSGSLDGGLRRYFRELWGMFLPVENFPTQALTGATWSVARDLTSRGLAVSALAVERYRRDHGGAAPSSLADVVPRYLDAVPLDPRSGGPLRYILRPSGYVVYSVGTNRVDDGGDRSMSGNQKPQPPGPATAPKDVVLEVRYVF